MADSYLKLCLVTQKPDKPLNQYLEFLDLAIQGGVTSVQLRAKHAPPAAVRHYALAIQPLLASHHIPFIINDHVGLALDLDADGVHLGQGDLSPEIARSMLGPNKIIGLSIETFEELERANQLNCIDYIAASAVFPSQSKQNCKTIWGLNGLQEIAQRSKHPVIAIGGITLNNICEVIAHGACGVAVISALHEHQDPFLAAKEFIQKINQG
ncbi:thiamine phosphate synthase [Legionella londiniensis]|uniref:Thiamine-phosphate synthase n=1 Tax=Legionella londiniensis TaxID=45068 RepID=A0A0W0VIG4_9GAMM|nr:thiamine phosphate synthase [Legionella londiniensis]KTD19908.1 phosphomethylpyrimidine kinase/thiamin-phosphate pyrophosphorylase [Legionella londiniensis]STX94220.1 phosphomethylpyrimidine kinase/thiamin-phosphate pyrophosphorylase [Legionella londiniensis]